MVVDKPAGMTSHDVVGRCRRIFGTRKVGHAGTLDPMATGVLVVGIERATKILGLLTATDKSYAATIRLGQTTTTEDAEGEVLQTVSAADVTDDGDRGRGGRAARRDRAGAVGGQRRSRSTASAPTSWPAKGRPSSWPPRPVRIGRFDVLDVRRTADLVDVDVEVDCSSGTYIRALARDVGAALGVGGHLTALRRTRVGRFGLDEARTLDALADEPRLSYSLDEACLLAFPRRDLTADEAESARHGRALEPAGIDGVYAAVAPDETGDCAAARPGRPGTIGGGDASRDAVSQPASASRRPRSPLPQGCPDRRWCPGRSPWRRTA